MILLSKTWRCLAALLVLLPTLACAQRVQLGIDTLRDTGFSAVAGKTIGLVTNQTSTDAAGQRDRVILKGAPGVRLVALFTPEHGLDGTELAGKYVASRNDPVTGLPAFSLYGTTRKPTPGMLRGLDALVFDLQDVGCRSYTYLSTMARCMEACGENNVEMIVLDRPNPLGGNRVEGPGIETQWISFVGQFPVPYVHGLTAGELAKMINAEHWMAAQCRLTVVPMRGWTRDMTWSDTGLRWIKSSPNIPRGNSPAYYVATGIVGNLSGLDLGIGTDVPFERVGAGYLNAGSFTDSLNSLHLPGVRATPFHGGGASGAQLLIDPHAGANLTAINVYLAAALYRSGGTRLFAHAASDPDQMLYKIYGSRALAAQIESGTPPRQIIDVWTLGVERFRRDPRALSDLLVARADGTARAGRVRPGWRQTRKRVRVGHDLLQVGQDQRQVVVAHADPVVGHHPARVVRDHEPRRPAVFEKALDHLYLRNLVKRNRGPGHLLAAHDVVHGKGRTVVAHEHELELDKANLVPGSIATKRIGKNRPHRGRSS